MFSFRITKQTSKKKNRTQPSKEILIFLRGELNPLSANFTKMAKQTQTIRRQFADELFQCVWPFCGIGA